MGCRIKSKAEKRYLKRLIWAMSAYLVVVLLTTLLVRHGHVTGWVLYVVAVLPCIPILRLIHVLALYVHEETDEFQRMLVVRSILCGGAAMLVVAAFSDFLRSYTKIGELPPFTMFMVFWVVFGLAQGVQGLMTRAVGDE
jgi:ABC-type proline/glycine betaine transport system permease subunit